MNQKIWILSGAALALALTACKPAMQPAAEKPVPVAQAEQQTETVSPLEQLPFYQQKLSSTPYLPANLAQASTNCAVGEATSDTEYRTAAQTDYNNFGWEQRVAADWEFFGTDTVLGRVLVIDYAEQDGKLAYRYLANANSHTQLYEPWSSSKVMAITGAVSQARQAGVGAQSLAGSVPVPDLITSIHTYKPFGKADGNSNAIASYLVNLAGREYLTELFHERWLKLSVPEVKLKGAYAQEIFDPGVNNWQDMHSDQSAPMPRLSDNQADPSYLPYRCETCGLTGNKPMTTLAEAEWLKRLASHGREAATRHPGLTQADIDSLFYGIGHSDKDHQYGGMLMGISRVLTDAIANSMQADNTDSKQTLDSATDGNWRVFQKIGWGPSGTRGTAEMVMLAHVCLPDYQGGREFTLAAQTSVPGDEEIRVNDAAKQMQALLDNAMQALLKQD